MRFFTLGKNESESESESENENEELNEVRNCGWKMTREEGIERINDYVCKLIDESGWWIFKKRELSFCRTRFLEPYERSENRKMTDRYDFRNLGFDVNGIHFNQDLTDWKDLCTSAIMTEIIVEATYFSVERSRYHHHASLLLCFHDSSIKACYLGEHIPPNLGHYLEHYRREYEQQLPKP